MIILDTNVLSEALRPDPDRRAMEWLASQPAPLQFAHHSHHARRIAYGVLLLPQGQRKHGLLAAVQAILDIDMAGRVLEFDNGAADAYA